MKEIIGLIGGIEALFEREEHVNKGTKKQRRTKEKSKKTQNHKRKTQAEESKQSSDPDAESKNEQKKEKPNLLLTLFLLLSENPMAPRTREK